MMLSAFHASILIYGHILKSPFSGPQALNFPGSVSGIYFHPDSTGENTLNLYNNAEPENASILEYTHSYVIVLIVIVGFLRCLRPMHCNVKVSSASSPQMYSL